MLILAIDTSSRTGSVAFLRDDQVVDEISGYEEIIYSTRLFRDLEVLQSRAHFALDQIDVFAVAAGPGSFTGLRVGLTAAKAWAEVHSKPIAAISGLEAIAAQSKAQARNPNSGIGVVAPFLDARRGQIFGSIYRRSPAAPNVSEAPVLELLEPESVCSAEEFVTLLKGSRRFGDPVFVSPTPDALPADLLAKALPGACVETVSPVLAPAIGRLAFEMARRGGLIDALHLDANYVRRSDAESAWKDTK